jgi:predicted ATPase/DNA-binding winged helix-turn-helix (wHTH) protein
MPILDFGPFQLFKEQHVLLEAGKPVRLGRRAFDVLALLVERAGEVVTKDEIARGVWLDADLAEANIRVHISALRRVLGDGRQGARYITSIANRGYCFVADVGESSGGRVQDGLPALGANREVPHSLSRVIGRSEAIEALSSLVSSRRLLSIVGPGGIGKTTVARGVLECLADNFEQRIVFVDLAPVSDPALVPNIVGTALGFATGGADPLRTILLHLAGKKSLIVLDNCEHLVAAAAQLAEGLLKGAPEVRILATSRESLKAEAEYVYRLPPLDTPPRDTAVSARDAMQFPAVELFVERAMAGADAFTLCDDNAGAVARICRRLDGIPLAIELAAATVNTFGVHALAAYLDENFSLLTRGRRTALPRQRTLQATLDWSYNILADREQALLRRLGIFAGAFTIDAAQSLLSESPADDSILLNDLGNLTDKSLVVLDAGEDLVSFRLLDSTRSYALEKLAVHGELGDVARRHASYYCALLQGMAERNPDSLDVRTFDQRPILDNVRSALDWSGGPKGDARIAVALTLAAVPLWAQLSLTSECVDHIQQARALYQRGQLDDVALEIELWLAEGLSLLYARGPGPEAGAALERAVMLERSRPSIDDVDRIMRTHNALSLYFNVRSEPRSSLVIAWRFYRRLRGFKNHPAQSIAEYSVGTALHSMGAQRAALGHLDKVISSYDLSSRARLTRQLFMDRLTSARVIRGWTLWLLGLPDQASRQATTAVDDTEHALSRCFALCDGVGTMALLCGDLEGLRNAMQALGEILETHRLPIWRLHRAIFENIFAVRRQPTADGLVELQRSIAEWANTTGYRHRLSMLIAVLAESLASAGQLDEAHRVLAPILSMGERGAVNWFMAELLRVEGELALKDGAARRTEFAERRFDESLDWARKQAALGWELRTAMSLARVWHDRGDTTRAYRLLAPVYESFTEGYATEDLRNARRLLGRMTEIAPQLAIRNTENRPR